MKRVLFALFYLLCTPFPVQRAGALSVRILGLGAAAGGIRNFFVNFF